MTCTVNKQSFPWTRNQAQIAKELKSNVEWDARSGGGVGKKNGAQQPVTKDRKTGGVEERARDHPVGMTGATERGEKRRER